MKSLYFMGGCPPFCPPATIQLYYMYPCISIGILSKYVPMYLCAFTYGHVICDMISLVTKEGDFVATDAKRKANRKYLGTLDEIRVRVKQDGTKEKITAHATARGESVNAFIVRAIREAMERDQAQPSES